ncbi:hypothetical protein DVH24_026807 [Malus domestica]|uniref:Uncharacterized protein n=1 Tax=Malus domestica TaxID=3750 RepID=A0A498K4Q4_MALDO|nr:hypothetical protein DVH24_026807 [Malus domestica]
MPPIVDDPIKEDEVAKDFRIVVVGHSNIPVSPIEPILRTPTSKSTENNIEKNMCSVKTISDQFEAPTRDILPNCDTYVLKKVARKCREKNIVLSKTFVGPMFDTDDYERLQNFLNSDYSGKDSSNNARRCRVSNHEQGNHRADGRYNDILTSSQERSKVGIAQWQN